MQGVIFQIFSYLDIYVVLLAQSQNHDFLVHNPLHSNLTQLIEEIFFFRWGGRPPIQFSQYRFKSRPIKSVSCIHVWSTLKTYWVPIFVNFWYSSVAFRDADILPFPIRFEKIFDDNFFLTKLRKCINTFLDRYESYLSIKLCCIFIGEKWYFIIFLPY